MAICKCCVSVHLRLCGWISSWCWVMLMMLFYLLCIEYDCRLSMSWPLDHARRSFWILTRFVLTLISLIICIIISRCLVPMKIVIYWWWIKWILGWIHTSIRSIWLLDITSTTVGMPLVSFDLILIFEWVLHLVFILIYTLAFLQWTVFMIIWCVIV